MRRTVLVPTLLAAALVAAPQLASADTLFGGFVGGFIPRGIDNRVAGDVLTETFHPNVGFRTLYDDLGDKDVAHLFSGPNLGGEVLFGLGDWIELGAGIGYYQSKDRLSYYTDYVDEDGTEIEQRTQMRIVPLSVTVRAFPIGRTTPVQPYVGGGVNFYRWRYKESGEFVDFSDPSFPTFTDQFVDSGTATGATILGGVRIPVGRTLNVGGEFRWQGGSADLSPELNFPGDKLDLSGVSLAATVHVRF